MELIHYSSEPLRRFRKPRRRRNGASTIGKPVGLWLSVGTAWLDWCQAEHFRPGKWRWATPVRVDADKLLPVRSAAEAAALTKPHGSAPFAVPDWRAVAREYAGVLFNPYSRAEALFSSGAPLWYYAVDVPSACVWDASAIIEIGEPMGVHDAACVD